MKYWKEDLRDDLDNNVPAASSNLDACNVNSLDPTFPDPAFWQHMTTFTLSLGVSGTLPRTPETVAKLCNGTESWPNPTSKSEAKIDDLWHAAINGHGKFFAAQNPDEFAEGLKEALGAISTLVSSASNLSVNSYSIHTDSLTFVARYYPGDWYGELLAYPVTTTGIGDTPTWTASIPAVGSRKIFTSNGSNGGIAFDWNALTPTQKTALGSQDIVDYLRGERSKEVQNGGTLRNRKSLLGDIIHSSPVYVDNYKDGAERAQTVFVGANDGMLHAFDATTGQERFAYVPNAVITPTLATLANPAYTHRYFVNGQIAVSDYRTTPDKNLLVASLGLGGKALFGLDVTKPKSFSAADVKWEFTGGTAADLLGLVTGELMIANLNDGSKAVIFGNGYNSTNQTAALFIVNLETGALIKAIDTGVGSATQPNGLAPPRGWDLGRNGTIDYVYAGDLQGNLWKFDLSDTDVNQWNVALKQGDTPQPLFKATDANGKAQPITARPSIGLNPADVSRWVFFGTGRYLTRTDVSDTSTQSWYGIIDDAKNAVTRSELKERKIVARGTDPSTKNPVRAFELATSGDMANKKGWYVDLDPGERIISSSQFYGSVLIASSIIPSDDPCTPGGTGYLNVIDPFTGAATGFFTDYGTVGDKKIPVGSINPRIGMISQPVLVANPDDDSVTVIVSSNELGNFHGKLDNSLVGRINWRELIRE
jgi:type IV pilus assembly protein PilY1